jgi:hypothetical protein
MVLVFFDIIEMGNEESWCGKIENRMNVELQLNETVE